MRALLVYNPAAGQRHLKDQVARAMMVLAGYGWELSLRETVGPGQTSRFAREAVEKGCDAVMVAGGDGSLNEAAQALANTPVALGVLPLGTGNVWAREMGIPLYDPPTAAGLLAQGRTRTVDLGQAGNRYFLLWAGVGFDARVVQEVETGQRQMKRRLGAVTYVMSGAVVAAGYLGTKARLVVDGTVIRRRVLLAVVSNAQLYAAYITLAPQASLDDGLLDLCVFSGRGVLSTVRHFAGLVARRHVKDPEAEYFRCRQVEIISAKRLFVHADGELIGTTPLAFRVVPQALHVLVPQNVPKGLFTRG